MAMTQDARPAALAGRIACEALYLQVTETPAAQRTETTARGIRSFTEAVFALVYVYTIQHPFWIDSAVEEDAEWVYADLMPSGERRVAEFPSDQAHPVELADVMSENCFDLLLTAFGERFSDREAVLDWRSREVEALRETLSDAIFTDADRVFLDRRAAALQADLGTAR